MPKTKKEPAIAALVRHGVYQYIRLPKQFHFQGDQVEVEPHGDGLIVRPIPPITASKPTTKTKC